VPRQSQGTRVNQNDPPITNYQLPITTQNQSEISNPKSAISYAQIQIIDTGVGISPDFLPHVFDYFRQADSTTTRCHGGLGLGLAIVHHLVELHNGQIYAHSEGEGKGATFTVNIPLAVEALDAEFAIENNGNGYAHFPSLDRVQVLVVEDNTDTRDFIVMVLEQFGAQVTAAACVREAMKCLQSYSPHVLVSDIGMPDQDGYSLIRQVRDLEQQRGENIPALALTAYAAEQDQKQALDAGFQMHLAKPIDPAELVTVVAELAGITKTINVM
ncbi:MAG TPA: ATPase, partial [Cyanobacteria bacterium UBA11372]|nr:ATPase [Cyanobacteria bacterium UBA11372]